jgi:hypothetical protein
VKTLPQTKRDTDYIAFGGGIDLATPAIAKKPGFLLDAVNYEPGINGGHPRIDAYERFDGGLHRRTPSTTSRP